MPILPRQPIDQPFVRASFVPGIGTLQDILGRQGDVRAQMAMQGGQGAASTWAGLAQAFNQYQQTVRAQQAQAAMLAEKQREQKEATAIKLLELDDKAQERAEQNRIRLETEGRAKRAEAMSRAGVTQPGVISSDTADALKDSGRVQLQDGVPVLMRTPEQVRQAGLDLENKTAREQLQHDRENDNLRMQAQLDEQKRHNQVSEAKQPRALAREVVQGPNGPLLVNKETGRTEPIMGPDGQPLKTAQSAAERMDSRKFQKSAPVLKAIGELSEKINVNNGVYAKLAGGAEKLKAKANLDDDVAEYEALVSGFTPLIARSLGHTGVLTQQDVDSVKAIFPRPGDSKSLRDRKVNRLLAIVSDLEQTEGVGNVAPGQKKNPNR